MTDTVSEFTRLLTDCCIHGVRFEPGVNGSLKIDAPRVALTNDLIARIKAHKSSLLDDPVDPDRRQKVYEVLAELVNAGHRGSPIEWSRLDLIESRLATARNSAELLVEVDNYRNEVVAQNDAGKYNQHRVA